MGGAFTNIYGDSEVAGKSPDASGDYYLLTDRQYDHDYFIEKIFDALTAISDDPDQDFHIFYGGVVSDGGSGTIDISACMAKGYDENNKKRFVSLPIQTGVSLPSGWDDGRQIWVVLKYDAKLGALTRTHKASGVYHYQLDDTWFGNASGLEGGSTDDLFVDVDPTGDDIILGSFTMTGTTYVDQNVRTETFRPLRLAGIINRQEDFNSVVERTGANAYKIKDEFVSLHFTNNLTGYLCYGATSFLSGGDTWGVLSTNNCQHLKFDQGTILNVGDTAFYLNCNTTDSVLENVWIKGLGVTAVEVTYSFLQDASTTGILLKNCKVSNRSTETSVHTAFYGINDYRSRLENCIVKDMLASHTFRGIYYFQNISNCMVSNVDISSGTQAFSGFYSCFNLSSCHVNNIITDSGTLTGFYDSDVISSCSIRFSIVSASGVVYGFSNCNNITACYVSSLDSGSGICYGFHVCDGISACGVKIIGSDSNTCNGFYNCDCITSCVADDIDSGSGDAYGFYACNYVTACNAIDITAAGGTANGFYGCHYMAAIFTNAAANATNDWVDTVDVPMPNKVSCPNVFT